jgi:hypothetical protein
MLLPETPPSQHGQLGPDGWRPDDDLGHDDLGPLRDVELDINKVLDESDEENDLPSLAELFHSKVHSERGKPLYQLSVDVAFARSLNAG